jgi:hypothetical protein
MVWLNFDNGDDESAAIRVEELDQANVDENIDGLQFLNYHFDEDIIVGAVINLLNRAFQKGCMMGCLSIYDCAGRVDEILHAASSLDMFDKISLVGDSDTDLSHHGFWSISVAIKFNKRLSTLTLSELEMTRHHAAALAAGLITSNGQNHFKELRMSDMFVAEEGAITELAFGLKHNSSICILNVEHCDVGDTELANLVGAVESHPSLKQLLLQGSGGQKHALVALGKVLASTSCRLEDLYLSGQGIRDHDGEFSAMSLADRAITELASGLKHNSSLCILNVERCHLGDAELAELLDAVESHPSLKQLSLQGNGGQKHTLVALGKVLASSKCQLEELNFSDQGIDDDAHDGLKGHLEILAEGLRCNKSLTRLDLSANGLLDKDMDVLGQILATCKLEQLNLSANRITHSGFVSFTKNLPKSLKSFDFSANDFNPEEAACHILTVFEEYPQLWEDGYYWEDSESPIHHKIQHFKDLNRCGRILLVASDGVIPLSIWPTVLERANKLLSENKERTHNAIFHLLQGPALMQRRFDRDSSQSTCVGASERLATSSKRGPAGTIDQASAKKERSE